MKYLLNKKTETVYFCLYLSLILGLFLNEDFAFGYIRDYFQIFGVIMIFCSSLQKAFRHLFHHLQYISNQFFSISFIVSDCTKNISVFNDKHTHNISALWGILHQKRCKKYWLPIISDGSGTRNLGFVFWKCFKAS